MSMRGKKAVEVAINTLVVIILGMVILGIGFIIIRKIIDTGVDLSGDVDDQLMESMRQTQFADGRQIAILNPQAAVNAGDGEMFLLGFVNKLGVTEDFYVKVVYSASSPVNADVQSRGIDVNTALVLPGPYSLANNEEKFIWIYLESQRSWPHGQYLYDVYVCVGPGDSTLATASNLYTGQKHRIFLTVQ